ncbi:hypothetical protein ColLi_12196 [Colletotrichum liriopes]|uniref:Uncharacterized protein n=1 Tax=Colletotrichum liriopes TaxID=708192 RepID=A0AA37GXY1_9PEZI|nr:hypothetical protein ColLi_12196 [Colletotrichum liriopes]
MVDEYVNNALGELFELSISVVVCKRDESPVACVNIDGQDSDLTVQESFGDASGWWTVWPIEKAFEGYGINKCDSSSVHIAHVLKCIRDPTALGKRGIVDQLRLYKLGLRRPGSL